MKPENISQTDLAICFYLFEISNNQINPSSIKKIKTKKDLRLYLDKQAQKSSSKVDPKKEVDNLQQRFIRIINNLVKKHFKTLLHKVHSNKDSTFDGYAPLADKGIASTIPFKFLSDLCSAIYELNYGTSTILKILKIQDDVNSFNPYVNEDFFDIIANLFDQNFNYEEYQNCLDDIDVVDIVDIDKELDEIQSLLKKICLALKKRNKSYDESSKEEQMTIINQLISVKFHLLEAYAAFYNDHGPFDGTKLPTKFTYEKK